jgi:HAD superfamily hydrolase (TIGR01509 family)
MSVSATADLAALLQRARVLLLDFDGPICAIFAGHPASQIARDLLDALRTDGHPVPDDLDAPADPFVVLRYAATLGSEATERTDARLRAAELAAVPTARPTPHADELIRAWRETGRQVAAVSNNSEPALTAYLDRHSIELNAVIGRTIADPALLKPNPYLVLNALNALGAAPDESLLLGDSPSDVDAGRHANIVTIGYANKPGKRERLTSAGAHVVIDQLDMLVDLASGFEDPLRQR